MLQSIHPKLPMRNKATTQAYYVEQLGFALFGSTDHDHYLMLEKDQIQLHFFLFPSLNPLENYGQVYIRTQEIEDWYSYLRDKKVAIHPQGHLEKKPWGQLEFSLLDPDYNLLTFAQSFP